jgi:hypothetical protein
MGQDFQTAGSVQFRPKFEYFFELYPCGTVCETSATKCPDDAGDPPVTQGTDEGHSFIYSHLFTLVPGSNFTIIKTQKINI